MADDRKSALRKLIEANPEDDVTQYSLGKECFESGEFDEAARAFAQAIELNPEYSAAYRDLGRVQSELGRTAEALETFRRGIEVARKRGDLQTVREMEVFARRAEKKP